jgi:hypothetical protein
VDFEEDTKLPGSIRNAISQKAARDLKKVDLNRAIENRKIIWLAIAAGIFLLASVVVAFLPPTRTELSLEQPKTGDITVFNNQEVTFEVRVRGRVPSPNDADAVRLRMWYNPDDPDGYEDRPLQPIEGDRRRFTLTVPPRQVRNGFHYRILGGNTKTAEYTVTCKIIPEFTGFDVSYEFPAYLKRAAEQTNDANLLAPYGTVATLTVGTNREVKHGHIEIEGQALTIDGRPVEGRPDAVRFTIPMEKEGFYRIWYTTPEGDKNQDPARLRLAVIDPKPAVRTFDIAYDYPAYLRFKAMTAADVREPEIEAPRGTNVVLTAKTTRGVKEARLELEGHPAVVGEPVTDEPMWVRFKLPTIDKNGTARVTFTPTTGEPATAPRSIPVRVLVDQPPSVRIEPPKEDNVQIAANGTLDLKGEATDDHGVDRLTLRMKIAGSDRDLTPKPYRGGMSFLRKNDNSWPTKVEYKDFVKLPDLRLEREPNWRVTPGMEIEYWLEAFDNCNVPPGPNRNESDHKRFKVTAPVVKPDEQKKIEQQNGKREQEQQVHEKRQDQTNQAEKRDVQQPPPKGAETPDKRNGDQGNPPERKSDPGAKPQDMNQQGTGDARQDTPPPQDANPDQEAQAKQIEKAIQQAENEKNAAGAKTGPNKPDAKADPGESRPQPGMGPMEPPPAEDHAPKADPKQDMTGEGAAAGSRPGTVDNSKDEKAESRDAGTPPPGMMPEEKGGDKQSFGGDPSDASKGKPDAKQPPKTGTEPKGTDPKAGDEKSAARPDQKADPTNPRGGDSTAKGATKPEKDVTPAETRKGSDEAGPTGDKPPSDAAAEKPKTAPEPGGARPEPKNDPVTDKGGSRGAPKEDDDSAGAGHPQPMGGTGRKDDVAKGGTKSGPGTPPAEQNAEQGELDRDLGELDRDINSTNPKIDEKRKSDVERLMRNPKTREQTRKKLDELERNAKDQLTRDKARDVRNAGEQAAQNYENEKPTEDNMDRLSKKLNSEDKREREDAEQRLKDWQNNPQTKKDVEDQADRLAKKDPKAGERVKDAMKKNEQAGNSGQQPKMDEKDLQQMAKDLNGSDEKAKGNAKQKLEKMMQDPKTRQQAQDKLDEMANKAEGQDKKDLQDAAKQAGEMARQAVSKEPGARPDPKLTPEDLKNAADKLANGTEKEKQEARDQLDKMMKDPKAAAEAQKQLQQMADNAKTDEEKQALADAAKHAGERAKELAQKQPQPKDGQGIDPKALKDAADKLANGTEKEKQEARDQLKKMMQDPKAAKEAQDKLREMANNAKTDEEKQALKDAAKQAEQLAKEMGPKDKPAPKPEDLKNMADKLAGKDEKAKEEARRQLEDMMKDPKAREEAMKQLEEMAKNAKPEDKEALQEALKQAAQMAKNQPPQADPKDLKDLAEKLDKMDPEAKEKLRKQLEEAMKDPKTREEMEKAAKEMAQQPKTPDQQRKFDELMRQMGGHFPDYVGTPDPADPRNKLKSAELLLEKFKKNITDKEFQERLGWKQEQIDRWMKDQEATIAALRKQAEKGDWRTSNNVRPPTAGGPSPVNLEPKQGGDLLRGGQAPPPPGYVDPYKKFTTEQSGGPRAAEPKR